MRIPTVLLPLLLCSTIAWIWLANALRDGEDALIERRYVDAVRHLQQALTETQLQPERDRILLLLGRAQGLLGQHEAAIATYRRIEAEHGKSLLADKARFQIAETFAASRRMREAAEIYRERVTWLVGLERKEEIAATYLGLAEKAVAKDPPDHARAVTFYDLALDLGLRADRTRTVRLLAAQSVLATGNHAEAIRRLQPLVDELTLATGRQRAMLALGRAKAKAGDRSGARAVFRDAIVLAKETPEAGQAAWEIALTFGVPQPSAAALDRAVAALQQLASEHPTHPQAKIASYLIARCQQAVGRSEAALISVRQFLADPDTAGTPERAEAAAMVGDLLDAQAHHTEAIAAWREYLAAHPSHHAWERVQQAIVDAEFRMAALAMRAGKERYGEARERFEVFMAAHPLDPRNPDILAFLGDMLFDEADDKAEYELARDAYVRCVAKYPGREPSSRAQFLIGEIYETKLHEFFQALEAYRKVTWGSYAPQAQLRIARLTRKHLALFTPRTFRSDEPATFELTSRNIEKLRVRVWRLELETYFRATHTAGDVERLDIEVIEPDRTFDWSVPEYKQYRETSEAVRLGFEETRPGAYVVKVDDGELEATTLVVVTDIGLIVKSSRHELLVFAQNLKEQRPEPGVRAVVSDCHREVAAGVTGADGVWRLRSDELKNLGQLVVFGVGAGGSGASTVDLSGLGYSEGLTPKAHLLTDRPAYEPGQVAHLKGIVREVQAGLYRLPQADGYRLSLTTASGRLMLRREIQFTPFGSFAADFPLPPEAELGTWRATLERDGGQSWHVAFEVARYERPRLSLVVEPATPVVFRGETLRGRAILRHFHGGPAAGRDVELTLRLPDGGSILRRAKTTAAGEVEFEFPTTEFAEEALAVVQVAVAEENLQAELPIPIVTTELVPQVSVLRPVYLAGEKFDARVKLEDRAGKSLARSGKIALLRLETRDGRQAEVEVAAQEFTSSADGQATVQFTANTGGRHLLRVSVRDRSGIDVHGQTALEISGKDDEIKLRLLTDKQSWRVGEQATVKVANRAGRRLVLRTLQADGILAADTFVLPEGESTLELPLQSEHAPNFALALSMIDGTHLHVAQREFEVARELRLTVTAPPTARPGTEIEVELEARDPHGRPVAAEIALSLVDRALLELFADPTPEIGACFFGQRRETEFRTASSCGWSYRGESRLVNAALVAEERARAPAEPVGPTTGGDDVFFGAASRDVRVGNVLRRLDELADAGRPEATAQVMEVQEEKEVAFDSQEWNSAVGLGGGAGGKFGGRRGGRKAESNKDLDLKSLAFHRGFRFQDSAADEQAFYGQSLRASDEPRKDFSETGAWLSAVVTGDEGRARVKLALPDSLTGWRLQARGVTTDTHVGQSERELVTRKELQASFELPPFLLEGDRAEGSLRFENLTERELAILYELATKQGAHEQKFDRQLALGANSESAQTFPLHATAALPLEFVLSAASGEVRDAVEHLLEVVPFGIEFRAGSSGRLDDERSFTLALPPGHEYRNLALAIEVGPAGSRELLRLALGQGAVPWNCRQLESTLLGAASRGVGALQVLAAFEQNGLGETADLLQLRALVAGAVARLTAAQQKDGGMPWVRGDTDLRTTAQALLLLAGAHARGFAAAGPSADLAADWLIASLGRARVDLRPLVLEALAVANRVRFEDLNSAHRGRASLDVGALARLALAWQAHGRGGLAGEVLQVMRPKLSLRSDAAAADVEAHALAAAALLGADRNDGKAAEILGWLETQRIGGAWATPEVTAAALRALCLAGGFDRATANLAEVDITVNGQSMPAALRSGVFAADVPAAWLQPGSNQVRLALRGRGKAHYVATLTGFAPEFDQRDRRRDLFEIRRLYLPAHLREGTQTVAPGFSVVTGRGWKSWRNEMRTLETGNSGQVEVSWWAPTDRTQRAGPLVVEEPLPAGCSVPRDSIKGNFDHVIATPSRLLFYYRDGRHSDTLRYELLGRHAGQYRVLPTRVYAAAAPELLSHGTVGELTVNTRGEPSKDPYRLTPDELYRIGKLRFEAGDRAGAAKLLEELLRDWQQEEVQLRDEPFKDAVRMLLFAAIEAEDSARIVRYFERLTERYPDLVIPFADIVRVGKAYFDTGEFERSLQVFRATAEASYLKEVGVATTLEQLGEVKASVQFLRNLLPQYPDLNTIRLSLYGVGQKLAALAAGIPDGAPVDERVGRREELRDLAIRALREFLVQYPDDPLADEVAFAWATTCVEGRDLDQALRVAERAIRCYTDSPFLDELLYTVGFVQFAKGQHEQAFQLLERVASEQFPRRGGGIAPSENRNAAIYLQGQIHHALGRPEQALEAYARVTAHFSDAVEAREYFLRKALVLPEVTTCALDAKAVVKLSHRNLTSADLIVYRVDLMRLYLLEKSLDDIRGIELHGIRPWAERKVDLGDGKDWRLRETEIVLELDQPGAYLVVARGGDLLATGLVLRSDLKLDVQEAADVGRVRVNVKRGDTYLAYADVKVVGSGDGQFRGGPTDLRGVFTAGDIVGEATVIVRSGEQFAFYRGETLHQPHRLTPQQQADRAPQQDPRKQPQAGYKSFDAWEDNVRTNTFNRAQQIQWLQDQVMNRQQKGVEVQRTK